MRFFSILSTALLFPVMAEAKIYDLADIKTGDIVSFCPTAIEIQQSVGYDKAYYCHGEISLEQDVHLIIILSGIFLFFIMVIKLRLAVCDEIRS